MKKRVLLAARLPDILQSHSEARENIPCSALNGFTSICVNLCLFAKKIIKERGTCPSFQLQHTANTWQWHEISYAPPHAAGETHIQPLILIALDRRMNSPPPLKWQKLMSCHVCSLLREATEWRENKEENAIDLCFSPSLMHLTPSGL